MIEVKSNTELDHVEVLPTKGKVVERVLGKRVEEMILVTVNVDREAYDRAKELGIEVICGNVID